MHPKQYRVVALGVFVLGAVWLLLGLLQSAEWFKRAWPAAYVRFVSPPGGIVLVLLGIYLIWQTRRGQATLETPLQLPIQISLPVGPAAHGQSPVVKLGDAGGTGRTKVSVGDYADFLLPGLSKERVRVTVAELRGDSKAPTAVLEVSGFYGVCGGRETKKLGHCRYEVPPTSYLSSGDPALFDYYAGDEAFWFLRIIVEHINSHAGQVTLNCFYARGSVK